MQGLHALDDKILRGSRTDRRHHVLEQLTALPFPLYNEEVSLSHANSLSWKGYYLMLYYSTVQIWLSKVMRNTFNFDHNFADVDLLFSHFFSLCKRFKQPPGAFTIPNLTIMRIKFIPAWTTRGR